MYYLCVILFVVKPHDKANIEFLENRYIVFGRKSKVLRSSSTIDRSAECQELSRYYPIHISVFYLFVELILLNIESRYIVPSQFNGFFQSIQTMKNLRLIKNIPIIRCNNKSEALS